MPLCLHVSVEKADAKHCDLELPPRQVLQFL